MAHASNIKLEGVVERAIVSVTGVIPRGANTSHIYREQTWRGLGYNDCQVKIKQTIADWSIFAKPESHVFFRPMPMVMKMIDENIAPCEILRV
jgi:hypothetical protein